MKIKKIKITNIRSHKNNTIELKDGVTVITGRTGSGKSTILMSVEYALFGPEAGIQNQHLLRRGAKNGEIALSFNHEDKDYTILRGLKRVKDKIMSNAEKIGLTENERIIPLMARNKDYSDKIKEILGIDRDVNAAELFTTITYTRQDEIRRLIEMEREKRQEQIDRILQIAKYKNCWENLKEVINKLELGIKEKEGEIKVKELIKTELENLRKEQNEMITKTIQIKERIKEGEDDIKQLQEEVTLIRKIKEEKEEEKRKEEIIKEKRRILKQEAERIEKEGRKLETEKEIIDYDKEEVAERISVELGKINSITQKVIQKEKELRNIRDIKTKECPMCKQEINEKHKERIIKECEEEIIKAGEEKERIQAIINELKSKRERAERQWIIKEKIKNNNERLNDIKKDLENIEKENIRIIDDEEINNIKKEFYGKNEELLKKRGGYQTSKNVLEIYNNAIHALKEKIRNRKEGMERITAQEKKIMMLTKKTELIKMLREDIRNIREAVREKFIQDFRIEFQKNYEQARNHEEEYTMEIKTDYEPVAYSSDGVETQIAQLSGGEKTSVALAYRLALSNIAAEISNLSKSEVIIMDEPTLGFDSEDIKLLPEILKQIRIPQIIIVTHEKQLEDAAEQVYYITKKKNNESIVTKKT